MKIAFEMYARQPDIKFVKDFSIRHAGRPKQFRLGDFKEPNIRAVKNNAGSVDVAPADTFFNSEAGWLAHVDEVSTGSGSDRVADSAISSIRRNPVATAPGTDCVRSLASRH